MLKSFCFIQLTQLTYILNYSIKYYIMKKIIFVFLLTVLSIGAFSQDKISQDKISQDKKSYIYCELIDSGKFFSTKKNVRVDFGQAAKFWKGVDFLKDESGKKITFNSIVDAANYMAKDGWVLEQAYVVTEDNVTVRHWIMKKEIDLNLLENFEVEE